MTNIPIQRSLLQPAEQEQGSKMMTRSNRPLSRSWRACNKNSIWLASKGCLINVACALVLRVIMLNNNIKILVVSFVHHIELQNFLNAPRTLTCTMIFYLSHTQQNQKGQNCTKKLSRIVLELSTAVVKVDMKVINGDDVKYKVKTQWMYYYNQTSFFDEFR